MNLTSLFGMIAQKQERGCVEIGKLFLFDN